MVKNVDSKYGFILIDIDGKNSKKGDVYKVTRDGKLTGMIIAHKVEATKSYCTVDKKLTPNLDKNALTGDIKVGDDVTKQK
jgi:hypothetical protein